MTRYVKLLDRRAVLDAPNHAVLDGRPVGNIRNRPDLLARLGYLPLAESAPPDDGAERVATRIDALVDEGRLTAGQAALLKTAAQHGYDTLQTRLAETPAE